MTSPMTPTEQDEELREQLRAIVTRNGKSVRIPELLEKELDNLMQLITADRKRVELEARIDELKRWQWKTDGHIELSGHDVDYRIAELEAQQEEVR